MNKLPLLTKIEYFNPESKQLSLYDSPEKVESIKRELTLLKIFCDTPEDQAEDYPYKKLENGSCELHPCFAPLSAVGINRIVKNNLIAEELTSTVIGYHKQSETAAFIARKQNGEINNVTLYYPDGTSKVLYDQIKLTRSYKDDKK